MIEPVIPLFPVLEEMRNDGKNNEGSRVDQPVLEEIKEPKLPDLFLILIG